MTMVGEVSARGGPRSSSADICANVGLAARGLSAIASPSRVKSRRFIITSRRLRGLGRGASTILSRADITAIGRRRTHHTMRPTPILSLLLMLCRLILYDADGCSHTGPAKNARTICDSPCAYPSGAMDHHSLST
jgi:hypothetical protein